MQKYMTQIGVFMLVVNILTLGLFALDKLLARRHRQRIPEAALLTAALCFGSLGAMLGMVLCRHKIHPGRHPAFVWGIPVLFLLQLAAGFLLVMAE